MFTFPFVYTLFALEHSNVISCSAHWCHCTSSFWNFLFWNLWVRRFVKKRKNFL